MNTYLVTYTLDNSDESYPKISARLKRYPNWAKLFARTWVIKTSRSSKRVRDELAEAIEGEGKIIVINISDSAWATYKMDDRLIDWLKSNV